LVDGTARTRHNLGVAGTAQRGVQNDVSQNSTAVWMVFGW
jgi:hypothetical protein